MRELGWSNYPAISHDLLVLQPERLFRHDAVGMIFATTRLPPWNAKPDSVRAYHANVLNKGFSSEPRGGVKATGKVDDSSIATTARPAQRALRDYAVILCVLDTFNLSVDM